MIQKAEKPICFKNQRNKGRNNRGIITSRRRGGGHKRLYRKVDFKRSKIGIPALVRQVEYDPNRNAYIARLHYKDGVKGYILCPVGLNVGDWIISDFKPSIKVGNALPLYNVPLGTQVHNIELLPGKGGQLVRSAGAVAQVLAKQNNFITLRLPSNEIRLVPRKCWATIGQVGNINYNNTLFLKAGRKRWLGRRPSVNGSVMNAVDHPHGGGEGRAPIGRPTPVTPWGKAALGHRTRKINKYSDALILRRRK